MPATPSSLPAVSRTSDRLAVLIGPQGSLSPADIAGSCAGLAELRFLAEAGPAGAGKAEGADSLLYQVASGLAPTQLVDFADPAGCLAAVRRAGATSVTTFVERLCPLAAWLNRELGADGGNAVPWGRKDLHRSTLRRAGLSRIASTRLHEPAQLRGFAGSVGFPIVVKPIDGFASRDTWLLTDRAELDALVAGSGPDGLAGLFAEQFITGSGSPVPWLADYLSVEAFRSGLPRIAGSDAFITHRPPPAWPFRETGLVLPSPLPATEQSPLIAHAEQVLDALGARRGGFHVELKPSARGPETIEVNGRIGGFIARAVRYGTGQDLGRLALASALGREPELDLHWNRCVLGLLFQPPADARLVVRAPGRRELGRLPGVLAVEDIAAVGTGVHWRNGTFGMVARLWLAADSHQELRECLIRVTEFLTEQFDYQDGSGRPVRELSWLETVSR